MTVLEERAPVTMAELTSSRRARSSEQRTVLGLPSNLMRKSAAALLLVVVLVVVYQLQNQLRAEWHLRRAEIALRQHHYAPALQDLRASVARQPGNFLAWQCLGDTYREMANLMTEPAQRSVLLSRAYEHYQTAWSYNRLEANIPFELGRVQLELAGLANGARATGMVDLARRHLGEAIKLRPYRQLYLRTLADLQYRYGPRSDLLITVEELGYTVAPRQASPYWREPEVKEAYRKGLSRAVSAGISLRGAYMGMASVLQEQGNLAEAVRHYRQGMAADDYRNDFMTYRQLGSLQLAAGLDQEAFTSFITMLRLCPDREGELERLYDNFQGRKRADALRVFWGLIEKDFKLSLRFEILQVRNLIELGSYKEAGLLLAELLQRQPLPEVHYWLARLAERQNDWDAMELAAQKATFLESENSEYHLTFSRALAQQKKFPAAEEEASKGIALLSSSSPWPYNQRAWLRWQRQDFAGAARDWQQALQLKPGHEPFQRSLEQAGQRLKELGIRVQ